MKQRIECIKDVIMDDSGERVFTKGKVYKADLESAYANAISDEKSVHCIGGRGDWEWFNEYFKRVEADEETVVDKIYDLSIKNEKSLEQIALKMSEEVGEVSQALLSHLKASGSAYKKLGVEDVIEECVDVMIVAYSLIYKLGGSNADISRLTRDKVNKWEEKVNGL